MKEEASVEPFFTRMASTFNQMEAIQLLSGKVDQIPDFCKRVKEVLRKEMGGDTPAHCFKFSKKLFENLEKMLKVSENTQSKLIEHFEPL
jgi:hypothetical protein